MNKIIPALLLMLIGTTTSGQSEYRALFDKAAETSNTGEYEKALDIFRALHAGCPKSDPLYPHVLWNYTNLMHKLVRREMAGELWTKTYEHCMEGLTIQQEGEKYFSEPMHKEIRIHLYHAAVASSFKLHKDELAKRYIDTLYKRREANDLPEGVNTCFFFDFFKLEDRTVWGVEFFRAEQPKNTMKIVFFVYSLNPDGSEGDLIYTLDLMQYHPKPDEPAFNYAFVTQQKDASGKLYDKRMSNRVYTSIDYNVIMNDAREILKAYKPSMPKNTLPPLEIDK